MNRREIVNQSITNMEILFSDIGRIIKVIEEQLKNRNFKALGNAAATWQNSTSLFNSNAWLPVWFARVYSKANNSKRAVGFCIHLGGDRYTQNDISALEEFDLKFPFLSVSLLEGTEAVSKENRTVLYEALWNAALTSENATIISNKVIKKDLDVFGKKYLASTYLVDLFSLTDKDKIAEMVVNPMEEMYKKNEQFVLKSHLPVIGIKTRERRETNHASS